MTKNDITGDNLCSKPNSELYRNNYDAIFSKTFSKPKVKPEELEPEDETKETQQSN